MPKEDYLLKYLEKLSRIIRAMFGMRDNGFPMDSIRLADTTYKELFDSQIDELALMPVEFFAQVISKQGYSSAYLEVLAQIAFETAKAYQQLGNETFADSFYRKTLEIYSQLNEKDKTFSFERERLILEIKKMITK